jgi:hypothetical protein
MVARFEDEPLSLSDEGGVVFPFNELRVEDDFAVGKVPLESFDESEVRKLAFDRLRSSLKNGMVCDAIQGDQIVLVNIFCSKPGRLGQRSW